ncbi:MAG TPA: putative baseplate assembly protein [Terracidiphilus sp.]|nr:putative baseplate assembly protein [Terracidiphilus sp.]
MNDSTLSCSQEKRREDVRAANLFGLDYVEVTDPQQLTLNVFFLGKAPQKIEKANLVLSGGRRIRDVQIQNVRVRREPDPTLDDYLEIRVNKPGDFSTYSISAVNAVNGQSTGDPMDGFDPRYSTVCFSFKASCPTDFDCKPSCTCPPPRRTQPDIDYLAKDYESFRQLILDRMAINMPQWTETHEPDIGILLAELLAYTGDYLSYYQDAVATEAYLGTARQRISVRRHARLVDYAMHDGCNARAWLTISTDIDQQLDPAQIYFITRYPGAPVDNHILSPTDLTGIDTTTFEVFEPKYWGGDTTISIYAAHSEIHFYTWGDCQCCLATGATSATLTDAWVVPANPPGTPAAGAGTSPSGGGPPASAPTQPAPATRAAARATAAPASGDDSATGTRQLQLKVGDILIFEEVLGSKTGQVPDADPTHRQAVRLTSVTPGVDPLYNIPVVEIEWASEDALTFPLCISSQEPAPDCGCIQNVSVARGNVIPVDHGGDPVDILGNVPTLSSSPHCPKCCETQSVTITSGLYRPVLTQQPLTQSAPLPPPCSAYDFMQQDPRQALPQIGVASIPPAPECPPADPSQSPQPCVMQSLFTFDDLANPSGLARSLHPPADANSQFLLSLLSLPTREALAAWDGSLPLPGALSAALITDMTALIESWTVERDLLESGPSDMEFVVEIDNDGYGHLRFGDGACGAQPQAGALFRAGYRVGNGTAGNVGAETITYIVFRQEKLSGVNLQPRNPMPAAGGVDPEPVDDVKNYAPYAFRSQLERAITAADYASIAADNARRLEERATLEAEDAAVCTSTFTRLQGAKADLRWTGSWYTALVALDPAGSETASPELIEEVTLYLEPFRRMGCDLLVSGAEYVPLKVAITVCVLPNYLRGDVEKAVLGALGNGVLPDGTLGFFNPDNLTFGGGVYVSQLLAAVQAVTGVQNAVVTDLERLEIVGTLPIASQLGAGLPPDWALRLGPFEIARLDNDPNYPEHGLLVLDVRGGR